MQADRAPCEDAPTPADGQQAVPAPGAAGADAIAATRTAADPVLQTLEGLLQRTRGARRFSLDLPPVHRQNGAFRASSSEGLRSVSTLSNPGDGGGPSQPGSRTSVEGCGSLTSDAALAGPADSRTSSPPLADWDISTSSGPTGSGSAGEAVPSGSGPSSSGLGSGVPRVDSTGGNSSHSGRSWAGASSSAGALDGSDASSSAAAEATATMLPRSRALAALFLRTKHQGVLTQTRPSQQLHVLGTKRPGEDDDAIARPAGMAFNVDSADGDDFRGGWAGRLASACIDKAGVHSGPIAGALAREAASMIHADNLSRKNSPPSPSAHAAPHVMTAPPAVIPDGGLSEATGDGADGSQREAPAAVMQMPFTGALDSVLEQHRTAREGILEANMNPAATVKALRAESAPADSKHPKQKLHNTRSTSMPESSAEDAAAPGHAGLRTASIEVEGMMRATSIAESLTDGEAMNRVLVEHWSRLDTLGAARGDTVAVAESMRPSDGSQPEVRRSASVGGARHSYRSSDAIDLLLANRPRSTLAQTLQHAGSSGSPSETSSIPEEASWAPTSLRAFSVPSIAQPSQSRASVLAAAVDADRQGSGGRPIPLHQQRPPPAPSAGAAMSLGQGPLQLGNASGAPELPPVLEHGSSQEHMPVTGDAALDQSSSVEISVSAPAGGSTFALAGPRVAANAHGVAGSSSGSYSGANPASGLATPFRGDLGQPGLASAAAVALHSAVVASSAAERMLAESIARHSQTSSNSATTHANSNGGLRLGSGSVGTRAGSSTSVFTEAMLMRRAAPPPAAIDSTLADVIARYSVNVSSPQQQQTPKPQPQPQSPASQGQQLPQQDQQRQPSPHAVEVRLMSLAAASAHAPAAGLPTPEPAVHVSWDLPPRGTSGQQSAQQPGSPSTTTTPGSSWRERDARRSGDSSSSGEYPGRYIRSLPMLLSITPVVTADSPDVVSSYLESMKRHFEGRDQQQTAGKSAGQADGSAPELDDVQSGTASVQGHGAAMAGCDGTEPSAAEIGSSRELRLQSLSSGSITAASRLEPSDICALLQRLQYGRSSAATVLSALQAIQTCTASAASAQVICGCGGVDVLLDLLTTGSSAKVLAAAAAALRDLLVWPKAQARRTASVSCLVLHATLELFHAAFIADGGVASLAALLQQQREPTVLAAVLAAVTAFVRAATAAASGAGSRKGSKTAEAVPECGRARTKPAASSPAVVDTPTPAGCCAGRTAVRGAGKACAVSPKAAATPAQRTPTLPIMLALDDGLVAAVVMILRRRTPDRGAEPELALPALQLISTIVTAKAAARQLIRGAAVVDASAGVLAAVPDDELAERGVLVHAALRLLAAFADDPLCTRAFCHSGFFAAALRIVAGPVQKALALRAVVLLATLAGAWPACQAALLAAGGDTALLSVLKTRCSVELTQGVIQVLSCLAASGRQRAALCAAGANAILSRLVYDNPDHAVQVCAMSLLAALNPVGARWLRVDGKSWLSPVDGPARPPLRLASAWSRVMRGQHPDPTAKQRSPELARANSF